MHLVSILRLNKITIPSLLKACAGSSNLSSGRKVHAVIIQLGLQSDCYIASALVNLHVKHGFLSDAVHVFDECSSRDSSIDLTLCNSMINGYFRFGCWNEAFSLFSRLQSLTHVRPDGFSLSMLLNAACDVSNGFRLGKEVHAYFMRNLGFIGDDLYLGAAMIDVYSTWRRPLDALKVFDQYVERSIYMWNSMIKGFCFNGLWEEGLQLFISMRNVVQEFVSATFSMVFTACMCGEAIDFGKSVHCDVIKRSTLDYEPYVCTSLITMYSKFALVEDAYKVFCQNPREGVESWNAIISAFVSCGYVEDAVDMYRQLKLSDLRPDSFSISNVLTACGNRLLVDLGKMLHGELSKSPFQNNMAVQTALVSMYAKCGAIRESYLVFDAFKIRDLVIWGTMVMGLCDNGKLSEALDLMRKMELEGYRPDSQIFANLLGVCGNIEGIQFGLQIHGLVMKYGFINDIYVSCAMIDMYAKCGEASLASAVFSGMEVKNVVARNSMMSSYNRNGLPDSTIDLFAQMLIDGLAFDFISITIVLATVSSLAALMKAKSVHGISIRRGFLSYVHVDNAFVDAYIKCGCLEYARKFFNKMMFKNLATWNSMILGTGSHGNCQEAIELFEYMQRVGVQPDEITFLALLSSCSHSGSVEHGIRLFESMINVYGIIPQMEHYVNMVDLLGRSGRLNEAYGFIEKMAIIPERSIWLCLLSNCRLYGDLTLGEIAAQRLIELEPDRSGNYIQLLSMYGEAGLRMQEANLRILMRERGLKKVAGCSWVEVKDMVHSFVSGIPSSPLSVEILHVLQGMKRNIEENQEVIDLIEIREC